MIGKPPAPDRIGIGSETSFPDSDPLKILTDQHEPVFQLGLLRWGEAKPYAHKREADRIISEPPFHRQFVGRNT